MTPSLFDPVQLGDLYLANRIVMAPLTRSRAGTGDAPTALNAEYYAQRASAGLIIAEGTQPSANGKGYCRTPGIYTPAQIDGWKRVTDDVHAAGGKIVLQIMHCGRISSRLNKEEGARTVAPSAIRAKGQIYTDEAGMVDFDEPHALTTGEVQDVIDEYRAAAAAAIKAGFDGVELHAASGYLPMQFLSTGSNLRTDIYGGTAENRCRFVIQTLRAMATEIGSGRVGIRICPGNPLHDIQDADPVDTYSTLLKAASCLNLAYVHLIRLSDIGFDALALCRENFAGSLILNESLNEESASRHLAAGSAEAVSFGRFYISNPDLVARFRVGAALARFDRSTLYTPGPQGYTDYPTFNL
ncbi:alkene reductase [Sphingobium estronivorans]|uniref:alkene reductase n=1 Tax=Sphingobium estronivorans TaxID=1577690 RepID=UPI0012398CAA|nr:alkene reductase [Sphingobium estronivorans]